MLLDAQGGEVLCAPDLEATPSIVSTPAPTNPSKGVRINHSSVITTGLDTAPLHGDGGVIGLEHVSRGAPSCVSPVDRCHQGGCRVATLVLRLQHTSKAPASIVSHVAADPSRRGAVKCNRLLSNMEEAAYLLLGTL